MLGILDGVLEQKKDIGNKTKEVWLKHGLQLITMCEY